MKRFIMGLAALTLLVGQAAQAQAGGGNVLPPTAKPAGYSLADMAEELAFFSRSGNDLLFYPDTPFQILYADFSTETGANTFTVKPGTRFFVPVFWIDDAPPVIGDFPADAEDAEEYVFGGAQFGAHDVEIEVDGVVTSIGPEYVAGPVELDDERGTQFIQVGAFLTPLSKGTHTVTIRGAVDGDAFVELFGGPAAFEFTYTVIVK